MVELSSEQKTKVVQFYLQTGSTIETKLVYRSIFGPKNNPSSRAISSLTQNFIETGTTSGQPTNGRKPIASDDKIATARESWKSPNALHPLPGPASQPFKICYSKHS